MEYPEGEDQEESIRSPRLGFLARNHGEAPMPSAIKTDCRIATGVWPRHDRHPLPGLYVPGRQSDLGPAKDRHAILVSRELDQGARITAIEPERDDRPRNACLLREAFLIALVSPDQGSERQAHHSKRDATVDRCGPLLKSTVSPHCPTCRLATCRNASLQTFSTHPGLFRAQYLIPAVDTPGTSP